jgi:hypothetical protein
MVMIQGLQSLNLLACPACRFDPNSQFTVAANLAVAFMAVVLAGVLGAFLCIMWKLAKAERQSLGQCQSREQAHRGESWIQS